MSRLNPGPRGSTQNKPVLIAGAGPTGLTAAMELTRFGVPVRLIDRYTTPPDTSRALAVQARTMELMQQRGLAEEMVGLGNKGLYATLYADGSTLGRVDLQGIDSRFNYILLLAQSETERILREHLERGGVGVERQTELIAFSQEGHDGGGVRAVLRKADGGLEEVDAAYLIDAEGAHSSVRHTMDLKFAGDALPNSYALADLHLEGELQEQQLSIFLGRTGLLAAFPMGDHRFRVIATEKDEVQRDAPDPNLDDMQRLWSAGAHIPVRFYDMVWSSRFRIQSRMVQELRRGSVFLGGDSAHVHSPAGGQGMNTGIQDMINLGWKLALVYHGYASAELLDTYGEERLPIIKKLVSTTERATDLFNADNAAMHSLIRHALPLALHVKEVRGAGAEMISELGTAYRKSRLSKGVHGTGQLRPGDRFPDVLFEDGKPARALDVLDASAFTVLTFGSVAAEDVKLPLLESGLWVRQQVASPSEELRRLLGDAEAAVVRPDGYLLCCGEASAVAEELGRWFAQQTEGHGTAANPGA